VEQSKKKVCTDEREERKKKGRLGERERNKIIKKRHR